MKRLAVAIVLALTLAAPALAAPDNGEAPAWVTEVVDMNGWRLVAASMDDHSVMLVRPAASGDPNQIEQRMEFREPRPLSGFQYLSMSATVQIDCAGRRLSPMSLHYFARNNLVRELDGSDLEGGHWVSPTEGSIGARLIETACEGRSTT